MGRLGVAIVGCGLIGRKRAESLGPARLVACVDGVIEKAQALASRTPDAIVKTDWRTIVDHREIDIVVVATTNDTLADISSAAIDAGKHVLVEKPAARNTRELDAVIGVAKKSRSLIRVGFNHRYHPAIQKARQLVEAGAIGELMFLRSRYGHGGRIGYDREWRANPAISGGGELIDQGVHLVDLSRWFLGDFNYVQGIAQTFYWQMPVDDNAFVLLRTPDRKVASLHCSCTEWKNLFSFEIFGRTGKLQVDGLGSSYGVERLTYYKMLPQMGPPETTIWEYPMADTSWDIEFSEFLEDIRLTREPSPTLNDAYEALRIVEQIYAESGYDYRA
jgi:predicted dehydrogenase